MVVEAVLFYGDDSDYVRLVAVMGNPGGIRE